LFKIIGWNAFESNLAVASFLLLRILIGWKLC